MTATLGPLFDGFTLNEVNGQLEDCTATFAIFVTGGSANAVDLARFDTVAPRPGDSLEAFTNLSLHHDLICEDRGYRSGGLNGASGESVIFLDAVYRRHISIPLVVRGSAGLNQIQTQKLPDGTVAIVEYDGRQQGGDLTVNQTSNGFSMRVTETTDQPHLLADSWANVVNSTPFFGGEPRTWVVSDVDYEPAILGPAYVGVGSVYQGTSRWHFTYRFEHNPDGWDPTAAYKDPETGEFPGDLIPGVGIKTFEYPVAGNLNSLFTIRSF